MPYEIITSDVRGVGIAGDYEAVEELKTYLSDYKIPFAWEFGEAVGDDGEFIIIGAHVLPQLHRQLRAGQTPEHIAELRQLIEQHYPHYLKTEARETVRQEEPETGNQI